GWKGKLKTLNQQVYFDAIGTKSRKAQIHFNDWFMDFPDPADLYVVIIGKSLASTPTYDVGFVNDPHINSEVAKLSQAKNPASKADEWAKLDQYTTGLGHAYVVPYGSELSSTFMSERMNYKDCNGVHQVFK